MFSMCCYVKQSFVSEQEHVILWKH